MSCKTANIVYSHAFTAQVSDINSDLFTPAADGFFRVSVYSDGSTGTVTLSYTDDEGSTSIAASGSGDRKTVNSVIRVTAGHPIHLTTTMDVLPFNLSAAIEKLD